MTDYYKALQVDPKASEEVIRAAWRELVKMATPDFKHNDTLRLYLEAKDALLDIKSRKAYDNKRNNLSSKVIGSYKLLNEIAEGGFGRTYKAEHLLTGGLVCMKHCSNISAKDDEILINETQAMWDLRHFAIPAVRDLIRLDDNSLILATSYIEGPTLEQVVQKIGAIPVEHVSWIVERILNALWYIHERGIVHGDLKPQNIILQHVNHHACLVDFGLSMIKPSSKDRCPGYTEYFSPPEQMDGLPLLPESDFYSLGVTIIYALVGGDFKHVTARDVPSNLPDPFAKFIKKLLVRDALQRPSWSRSNIFEEFQQVRAQSFGRGHTNMEPIKGL